MNFLIDLWKKATKGDSYRATENPVTYNDKIAQLNSVGSDQARRLTTSKINKIRKTNEALTQTNPNTTVPGSR